MKKTLKALIFALLGFMMTLLSSCTYINPAFPEELRKYFPYEEGQQLTFKNVDNEIEQYTIKHVYVNKEEKHTWNCKCKRDDAHMYFEDKTGRIEGSIYAQTKTKYIESDLQIEISFNNADGDNQKSFSKSIPCNPFSETIIKDLGDTIVLTNENDSTIIVRNRGIVEYNIENIKWKNVN